MRNTIKRARRARIRKQMDRLGAELMHSIDADPDGFAEREDKWMQREALRDRLHRIGGTDAQ